LAFAAQEKFLASSVQVATSEMETYSSGPN
jgi:hypothetical protein